MSTLLFVVLGIAVGLIGTLPMALLLERVLAGAPVPHPVPVGIALFIPLVFMCVSVLLVRIYCATMLPAFALAMIGAIVVVWATEGVRAWLAAQRHAPNEGM